jgi:YesN/AraC family two-component response regulator
MPEMNGVELAAAISKSHPSLTVIIATGYGERLPSVKGCGAG